MVEGAEYRQVVADCQVGGERAMTTISAQRIAQAIAAIKALESAWLTPGQHITSRIVTDLTIAKCDLESALTPVHLTIKEAA